MQIYVLYHIEYRYQQYYQTNIDWHQYATSAQQIDQKSKGAWNSSIYEVKIRIKIHVLNIRTSKSETHSIFKASETVILCFIISYMLPISLITCGLLYHWINCSSAKLKISLSIHLIGTSLTNYCFIKTVE